jgi:ABC-2 type transport system permease protein
MLFDIWTIIRKEWKEVFLQRGSVRSGLLNMAIVLGVLGVFLPLEMGPEWLSNPVAGLAWLWMPVMLTMNMVADAFAGERERHTLETLLASRLSDRAILFGKMAASVLYGFSMGFLAMLVGAISINLAYAGQLGRLQFYPAIVFVGGMLLILLSNTLMAALGVLVSLRAKTVRQAFQQLSVGLVLLFLIPIVGLQFAPAAWKAGLLSALGGSSAGQLLGLVVGVVFVLDGALTAAAFTRFQRAKLLE